MKDSVKSGFKKFLVGLIACLMLLGVVPIGMITMRPHTADDTDAFLRFAPETEACVSAAGNGLMNKVSTPGLYRVGCRSDVYFKLDLQSFSEDKIIKNLSRAVFRMIALPSDVQTPVPVRLWLMPSSDRDIPSQYADRPVALGETKLAEWNGNPIGKEAAILETDLTEQLKKWVQEGRHSVSLHLDTPLTSAGAVIAGSSFEDASYRPCFKVICGAAEDPDPSDLTKSVLMHSAISRDGSSLYLQYRLDPRNIQGAMYQVALNAAVSQANPAVLPEAVWNENSSVPEGEKVPVLSDDEGNPDLTDAVNDAYAAGKTEITVCLTGEKNLFSARGRTDTPPSLTIRVSDDKHIVSAVEASVYALRNNRSPLEICTDLSDSYTTEDGTSAELRWTAVSPETGEKDGRISEKGRISRPAWFQNPAPVLAEAHIKSGDYTRIRRYVMNLIPESMPEFDKDKITDYMDISQSSSSSGHCLENIHASTHSHWIGSRNYSYRAIEQDSLLAVTMKTQSDTRNYLTLKVWGEEISNLPLHIESLQNPAAEPMILTVPEQQAAEDGFLYLTYPIPEDYITEQDHVRLRMFTPSDAFSETAVPWKIYGIFTGQAANFHPQAFAKQGERYEKTIFGQPGFSEFLQKLYRKAQDMGFLPDTSATLPAKPESPDILMDGETGMLAIHDLDTQLAVFCPRESTTAEIFRSAASYNAYARVPVSDGENHLSHLDYGVYQILFNRTPNAQPISESFGLSGVYRDLQSDICYAFLQSGELADDSVLPDGAVLKSGSELYVNGDEPLVLKRLSAPLYASSWRVSAINGISVSQINRNQPLTIAAVTVKDIGSIPESQEKIRITCGIYEQNRLIGFSTQTFEPIAGHSEYHIGLAPVTAAPGQQLKIFVEPANQEPHTLTPKLEL